MFKKNRVREKIRAGQLSVGCFTGLQSPVVAELLSHVGFEWIVIESEHNALDTAQIEHMLMAMNGTDVVPLVRIPSAQQVYIQRALDIGGMGVVVPLVRTAAEAEAIVRATRYPPEGTRSFGPLRASHFTFDYRDYFDQANENMLVMLILETKEALENLDEITSVPGVDALYFGFFDLCLSMGLNPFEMPFPEVEREVDRAIELCRRKGVAIGTGASSPEQLEKARARGMNVLGYGPDYIMLANAMRPGVEWFKGLGA